MTASNNDESARFQDRIFDFNSSDRTDLESVDLKKLYNSDNIIFHDMSHIICIISYNLYDMPHIIWAHIIWAILYGETFY